MIKQILILLFVLMLLPMTASAVVNSDIGDLTLYSFNGTEHNSIPTGFYLGTRYLDTPLSPNTSIAFNESLSCIDFTSRAIHDGKTQFFVSGLYPATDQTLEIEIGIDTQNWNGKTGMRTSNAWIVVQNRLGGIYRVTSYWYNPTTTSSYFDIPADSITGNKIKFSIISNETARTNTVKYSDALFVETPYVNAESRNLPYTFVNQPIIYFYNELSISTEHTTHIYSISQSIPRKTVTPHGSRKYTAFGIDGPHPVDTVINGTTYATAHGHSGTVWADILYLKNGRTEYIQSLLDNGWELGIHYSTRLTSKSLPDAYAQMDSEYATISNTFGVAPVSWCSFQNADNVTHAAYAYNELGMVWRNGYTGISYIPTVGNVDGRTWDNWWMPTVNNSGIYPTFTHQLDIEPAITYSLDYSKFLYYVDTYTSNNIKIVGFEEYYLRNANQKDAVINILESDDTHITFSVQTNGYPVNLNVAPPSTFPIYGVYDLTSGTPVLFTNNTESATFEAVDSHTYVVYDQIYEDWIYVAQPDPFKSSAEKVSDGITSSISLIAVLLVVLVATAILGSLVGLITGVIDMQQTAAIVGVMVLVAVIAFVGLAVLSGISGALNL